MSECVCMYKNMKINIAYILQIFWNRSTLEFCRFLALQKTHLYKEDDVISHHNLVVVLHAAEGGTDLSFCKWWWAALVDALHQSNHAHWLSMRRAEHLQQCGFELLQPKAKTHIVRQTYRIWNNQPSCKRCSFCLELNQKQYFKKMWRRFKNAECRDTDKPRMLTCHPTTLCDRSDQECPLAPHPASQERGTELRTKK